MMMSRGGGGHQNYDGWDNSELGSVYNHKIFVRLIPYIKPHKIQTSLAFFGMLSGTLTNIAIPPLIGFMIDAAIASSSVADLWFLSILFFGCVTINSVGTYLQSYYIAKVAHSMLVSIRTDLFRHLQKLSLNFYDRQQVGRLMSRVVSDVEQIQQVMTGGIIGSAADILSLVGIILVMFSMDWKLSIVSLSVVPALIILAFFWQKRARVAFLAVRSAISVVNGTLQENVSGVRVVQNMNREPENMKIFESINGSHLDANLKASRLSAGMFPSVEIIVGLSTALVVSFGGWLVIEGAMGVGTLVAFGLFVQRFFDPIRNLTMQYTELQRAMASGVRIFDLFDTQPSIFDSQTARPINNMRGQVSFNNVSFGYTQETTVLDKINIDVSPGETIALVGQTGAGKTTFVSLIARFYDVTEGQITIDGIDIREITMETLAAQTGIVLQEPFLFTGSVEDNIKFGNPSATKEEVVLAAKTAGIHELISQMPQGYQTLIQERGSNLSMGHQQLISIARAVVANPRLLILDEATANIDTQTETVIQSSLKKLLSTRTSFVIAHRLSTIRDADRIAVFEDGKISGIGTHSELLETSKKYRDLHSMSYLSDESTTLT
ncbi:MAG: ABC transporter ATP-binding protein [Chloroflexota bacterium]|nr:ABC transporter ATP-binding protein [Chloroflexota bacterium]